MGVCSFCRFQKSFSRPPLFRNTLKIPLHKLGSPNSSLRCIIHATMAVVAAVSSLYALSLVNVKSPNPYIEWQRITLWKPLSVRWHFIIGRTGPHFPQRLIEKVSAEGIRKQALCWSRVAVGVAQRLLAHIVSRISRIDRRIAFGTLFQLAVLTTLKGSIPPLPRGCLLSVWPIGRCCCTTLSTMR